MALDRIQPAEPINVLTGVPQEAAYKPMALFKGKHLEVARIALQPGAGLPMHKVAGEITIHCLQGHLLVNSEGNATAELLPGELIYLPGGVPHDLHAVGQDGVALVTIALRND
ncbi:MAG: cupin domain-containing protein [Brachymonas sp.]|nr:cupin domain-containing protein [Brachymonas sp.]